MPTIENVTLLASNLPKMLMSGPASPRTTYSVHMTGPVTGKEVDNLIRVLQLYREWIDPPTKDQTAA